MHVAIGTVVLVAIVLALVVALLLFEHRFVPHGPVTISFEAPGAERVEVEAGGTLLGALGQHDILLPAACGGAGTCGLCRVRVVAGGGDALPPERVHLTCGDVAEGWRLACQLRVRGDLAVALPPEVGLARRYSCVVRSTRDVATFIREIVLALPAGERFVFEAGSFVQVHVPVYRQLRFSEFDLDERCRADWQRFDLLTLSANSDAPTSRAYSLANPPAQSDILVLNVRIATPPRGRLDLPPGVGSSYLYGLRPGDRVEVSGPFGDMHIRDSEREAVYVGGGAGMAPLRSHLLHLFRTLHTTRRVSYWYGARSVCELFYTDEFEQLAREHPNFSFHIALSEPQPGDEWSGDTGFIHEVVRDRYLADHPDVEDLEFYLCGPPLMLSATRAMLDDLGVDPDRIAFDDFGS